MLQPPNPRVCLDTNVMVSALLYPKRAPGRIIAGWQGMRFRLVISRAHQAEVRRILDQRWLADKYHVTPKAKHGLLRGFRLAEIVVPTPSVPVVVRDVDDEKILAEALGGRADYLVTGDKDLLTLADDDGLGSLRIVSVTTFLHELDAEQAQRAA